MVADGVGGGGGGWLQQVPTMGHRSLVFFQSSFYDKNNTGAYRPTST